MSSLSKKFFDAVSRGDLPTIQQCVRDHINVNTLNSSGYTALELAVLNRNVAVVEYLSSIASISICFNPSRRPLTSLAVQSGYPDILSFILKKKPNLNIVDYDNDTPLLLAIRNYHYDNKIVKMLIEAGADINFDGAKTPLSAAVERSNIHIVKELVQLGADVNKSGKIGYPPLLAAVSKNNLDAVKYLVSSGADINALHTDGSTCLSLAVKSSYLSISDYLVQRCCTKTAFFLATKHGHLDTIKYLMSKNDFHVDDIDSNGNTALTVAIKNRQETVANFLIECKADVCKCVPKAPRYIYLGTLCVPPGEVPLLVAVETKNISMIHNLLDHGAQSSIHTAFRKAVEIGSLEIVKLLREKGANVKLKYRDGNTSITTAANKEHFEILKFLIEQGANVNQVDGSGRSVLGIAASKCSFQIVKFLLDCNADIKLAEKELESFASLHEDAWFLLEEHKSKMAEKLTGSGNDAYKA